MSEHEKAFQEWARTMGADSHDSESLDEWEDLGRDEIFAAGWQAALSHAAGEVPEHDLLKRYREAVEETHRTRRAGPAAPNADLNRALVEQEQVEAEIDAMLAAAPTVKDSLTDAAPGTGKAIYYLYKEGLFGHGVFWIGGDLEEGKRQANKAATLDTDDYHDWVLYIFSLPESSEDYDWDSNRESHTRCYVGIRGAHVGDHPND